MKLTVVRADQVVKADLEVRKGMAAQKADLGAAKDPTAVKADLKAKKVLEAGADEDDNNTLPDLLRTLKGLTCYGNV
jgi:hypothetical protein